MSLGIPAPALSRRCVEDGPYRYVLSGRAFNDPGNRTLLWVMLNPSTANAAKDDPTSRKVAGFTRGFDFDRWAIVNVYAYRATDPKELGRARFRGIDIGGPDNWRHQNEQAARASRIVVAWGAHDVDAVHLSHTLAALTENHRQLYCLGTTKSGAPKHPLYVPYSAPLVEWRAAS